MNAPLLALQALPPKLNADPRASSISRNRADDARTLRETRAEPAPDDRFSDQLRKASRTEEDQSSQPVETTRGRDEGATVDDGTRHTDHTDHVQDTAVDAPPTSDTVNPSDSSSPPNGTTPSTESASTAQTTTAAHTLASGIVRSTTTGSGNAVQTPISDANTPVITTGEAAQAANQSQRTAPVVELKTDHIIAQVTSGDSVRATTPVTTDVSVQHSAAGTRAVESTNKPANVEPSPTNSTSESAGNSNTKLVTQPAGQSSTQTNSDQNSQQQQPQTSQPQQIQQRVQQAVANGISDDAQAATAAQRRAGSVNANIRFEQTTGAKPVSIDTSSAPPVLATTTINTASLELGSSVRTANAPVLLANGQAVDEPAVTGNIVRGLSALVNQRGGVMHMRLDPPDLGQIRVQMNMNQGTVTAQFETSTTHAQAILERNIAVLRTALERHGMTVERLTVQVQQPAQNQNTTGQNMNNQSSDQSGQNQHNAGGGESRGRGEQSAEHRQQQSFERYAQEELYADSNSEPLAIEAGASS